VFLTLVKNLARINLVVPWVVLLFFPAMTKTASVLILTAIGVSPDKVFDLPVRTKILLVIVDMWFAPQILPVMSIHATFFIMIFTPWAPNCLKVEHIKVRTFGFNIVKEVDCYFFLRMSKGTHFSIITVDHIVRVCLAKLTFVFLRVIELFDSIVSLKTVVSEATLIVISSTCNL